jgi:chromate transporter
VPHREAVLIVAHPPDFLTALRFWAGLGCINFGGPAAQIALMQEELVERRRWIDPADFAQGMSLAMALPGPEAQQLATYIGWRLHGTLGGIASGLLFIVPGAALMLLLSYLSAHQTNAPWLEAAFAGLIPIAAALLIVALLRMARRTLKGAGAQSLALLVLLGMEINGSSFPLLIAACAAIGALAAWLGFLQASARPFIPTADRNERKQAAPHRSAWGPLGKMLALAILLWAMPTGLIGATFGREGPWLDLIHLFSKAALVSFGGAYAALSYVGDLAVQHYHWLSSASLIKGIALAEAAPGPLILAGQHIGFMAGWSQPGMLAPEVGGVLGAMLVTYVTFLPSFFFILGGAPLMEGLLRKPAAAGALFAMTAGAVGAMASLAVHVVEQALLGSPGWGPQAAAFHPSSHAALLMIGGVLVLWRWRIAPHWLLLAGIGLGILHWHLMTELTCRASSAASGGPYLLAC